MNELGNISKCLIYFLGFLLPLEAGVTEGVWFTGC